jgi:AraC-like DNA-binding protein
VLPAATATELLADPVGRYVGGQSFVAWMQSTRFVGASHFGPFDGPDLPAIVALAELPFHPALVPPYDVIHDLGAVGVLDRRSFEILEQYLSARMPELVTRARRLAVVRPAGLAGAAFTGLFHDWAHARCESRLFTDRAAALDWLELASDARGEVDAIIAPFEQASPVLRRVRDAIAASPGTATLDAVATAIGHSSRSLQRHLAEHGASFRDELIRGRVEAAKARLVESDDKIEVIAREVGFSSAAALTALFTRVVGESPNAFRERRRG